MDILFILLMGRMLAVFACILLAASYQLKSLEWQILIAARIKGSTFRINENGTYITLKLQGLKSLKVSII